jgi:hypothetical protein
MNWLNNLVSKKKTTKKTTDKKHAEVRYHVKSDGRIVKAYKNEGKPGYVYHKRTENGVRNVPINSTTYATENEAKAKSERIKSKKK